jgi:hypothetical protein
VRDRFSVLDGRFCSDVLGFSSAQPFTDMCYSFSPRRIEALERRLAASTRSSAAAADTNAPLVPDTAQMFLSSAQSLPRPPAPALLSLPTLAAHASSLTPAALSRPASSALTASGSSGLALLTTSQTSIAALDPPEQSASPAPHVRVPVTYNRGMDRTRRDSDGDLSSKARTFRALSCSPFVDDSARSTDETRLSGQPPSGRPSATSASTPTPNANAMSGASVGGQGSATQSLLAASTLYTSLSASSLATGPTLPPGPPSRNSLLSPTEGEEELISLEAILLDGPVSGVVQASPHNKAATLKVLSAALPASSPRALADAAALPDARPASLQQ